MSYPTYPGKKNGKSSSTYPGKKNSGGMHSTWPVSPGENPYRGIKTKTPKK